MSAPPAAAPWKPPVDTNDIKRLSELLHEYEAVNFRQIEEIKQAKQATHDIALQIQEYEKVQRQHLKKIKSLEAQSKIDRIAAEGLRKKSAAFEAEAREFKHAKEFLTVEHKKYKDRLKECEDSLFVDRSKRLGLLHENELLRKQLVEKEDHTARAEKDALFARNELLTKMQLVETLKSVNESQKMIVQSQSEEMILLSNEVYNLKEKQMERNDRLIDQDNASRSFHSTIHALQMEVYRLRKELNVLAESKNEKSVAFGDGSGASNATNRLTTQLMSKDKASRYGLPPSSREASTARQSRANTSIGTSRTRSGSSSSSSNRINTAARIDTASSTTSASSSAHHLAAITSSSWGGTTTVGEQGFDNNEDAKLILGAVSDGPRVATADYSLTGNRSASTEDGVGHRRGVLYFYNDKKNQFEPCDTTGAVLPVGGSVSKAAAPHLMVSPVSTVRRGHGTGTKSTMGAHIAGLVDAMQSAEKQEDERAHQQQREKKQLSSSSSSKTTTAGFESCPQPPRQRQNEHEEWMISMEKNNETTTTTIDVSSGGRAYSPTIEGDGDSVGAATAAMFRSTLEELQVAGFKPKDKHEAADVEKARQKRRPKVLQTGSSGRTQFSGSKSKLDTFSNSNTNKQTSLLSSSTSASQLKKCYSTGPTTIKPYLMEQQKHSKFLSKTAPQAFSHHQQQTQQQHDLCSTLPHLTQPSDKFSDVDEEKEQQQKYDDKLVDRGGFSAGCTGPNNGTTEEDMGGLVGGNSEVFDGAEDSGSIVTGFGFDDSQTDGGTKYSIALPVPSASSSMLLLPPVQAPSSLDSPQQQQRLYSSQSRAQATHSRNGGPRGAISSSSKSMADDAASGASKRSMFVGSGLGLRHNPETEDALRNLSKGSTRQMLKRILGDREFD